jgi:hypothetical protein
MKGKHVGLTTNRRWPLHPRPSEWEDLETWVRRIAEAYGVSYDAFLLNALDHTGRGARDLNKAPDGVIARLSIGTGISIERVQDMTSSRIMARLVSRTHELLETPEGQMILHNLIAMGSRNRRRASAVRGF